MRYPDCPDANSFQSGLEFQDFVCLRLAQEHVILQNTGSKLYQLRIGENLQGFEIKLDRRCTETGRLSIEIAEQKVRFAAIDQRREVLRVGGQRRF